MRKYSESAFESTCVNEKGMMPLALQILARYEHADDSDDNDEDDDDDEEDDDGGRINMVGMPHPLADTADHNAEGPPARSWGPEGP